METTSEPPFNLKYRATGAIILLSVPVLLLPWLLGGQNGHQAIDEASLIPEPKNEFISSIGPAVDVSKTSINLDPDISSERADQIPQEETESSTSEPAADQSEDGIGGGTETVSDSNALSGAQAGWVVRVGVFSEPDNLKRRADLLSNNGMTSRQETIEINGRPMVRIFLGPFADLATAERESGKAMLVTGEPAFVIELN